MTTGLKLCCKCKESKPLSSFGRLSEAKDGFTYACLECTRIKMKIWRDLNKPRDRTAKNRWAEKNKEQIKKKSKRYYAQNKEKHKAACNKWARMNPSNALMRQANRRAAKKRAIPGWLTAIEQAQIQEMYDVALSCTIQTGIQHHVDHIFPLQGKNFCGLHVPWNLQVVTAIDNLTKLNNFPTEYTHLSWSG